MSCCANCSSGVGCAGVGAYGGRAGLRPVIQSVGGFWGSLGTGISSFLGSNLGTSLLQIGTTVGTAYLTQELFDDAGNSQPRQTAGQTAAPTSPGSPVQPIYSAQPPLQAVAVQQPAPDYMMPMMIGAAALIAVVLLTRK